MKDSNKNMEDNIFKLFPWDNGEKPFWTNPENGIEWYVDKSTSDWCTRENLNSDPPLDAVVFYVCEKVNDKVNPIERVLIDRKTNEPLYFSTSLEQMAVHIDMLRVTNRYQ